MFLGVDSLIPRLHQMEPGNEVKVSSFQRLHQYELEFSSVVLSPPLLVHSLVYVHNTCKCLMGKTWAHSLHGKDLNSKSTLRLHSLSTPSLGNTPYVCVVETPQLQSA